MSNPSRRWSRKLVRRFRKRLQARAELPADRTERELESDFLAGLPERLGGFSSKAGQEWR